MNEIVEEFLVETSESLDQLDRDLVALETDPASATLLASVFRTFHTVKGTTGFLGFSRLETLSHAAESLLSDLREGSLPLTPARTDLLLDVVDAVRALLAAVARTGAEDERDLGELLERIEALRRPDEPAAAPSRPALRIPPPPPWAAARVPEPAPPASLASAVATPPPSPGGERTVRVDVDLLDRILRQVGELVLARNQIVAHAGLAGDAGLHAMVQRLSVIVSELQEDVTKTRMQPVEQLFAKLPRVVRDLAAQLGKQVRVELEGGETELDRSLLEAVKDPLTHLVRNAVDHGLEDPARRRAVGKAPTGLLTLRASHEGGQVVIEVADDGGGIDPARVAARAVERGLIAEEEVAARSERELLELVFEPGFSTATAVTNLSGRGVGMDVVRTNVERIGGTVDLASVPGEGTTVRVRIPLTLAIVPALLVGSGGRRYAIPQVNLLELVQLRPRDDDGRLERLEGALLYRLRDILLPLVRLHDLLGGTGQAEPAPAPDSTEGSATIAVVQADGALLGVLVDEVLGTEEIVVKPLGRHLAQIPVFAGATILGDGGVALILDVPALAAAARLGAVARSVAARLGTPEKEADERPGTGGDRHRFVLLRVGHARRVAVPLASVARLEEAPVGAIEQAGGRPVLQYRGELLPLVRLAEVLGEAEDTGPGCGSGSVPVLVSTDGARRLGLVASEILDIVEGSFEIRAVGAGSAVAGSTVLQGKATDVLDVQAALDQAEVGRRVA